jgi:hypothetical protein
LFGNLSLAMSKRFGSRLCESFGDCQCNIECQNNLTENK